MPTQSFVTGHFFNVSGNAGNPMTERFRWQPDCDITRSIFNAALTGICANPAFFGPLYQGSPAAAVEFAESVVKMMVLGDTAVTSQDRA